MCWNSQVSLNTFLFATFAAIFGYINGFDKKLILFFYVFSLIQFIEYMLWNNLNNKVMNMFLSNIGYIVILLEPYFSINILDRSKLKNILYIIYTIYIIIAVYLCYITYGDSRTIIGKNGHLEWKWLPDTKTLIRKIAWVVWFTIFFIPLVIKTLENKSKYLVILIFGLFTTVMSFYYYFSYGTFGSMWCWSANFVWLFVIFKSIKYCSN